MFAQNSVAIAWRRRHGQRLICVMDGPFMLPAQASQVCALVQGSRSKVVEAAHLGTLSRLVEDLLSQGHVAARDRDLGVADSTAQQAEHVAGGMRDARGAFIRERRTIEIVEHSTAVTELQKGRDDEVRIGYRVGVCDDCLVDVSRERPPRVVLQRLAVGHEPGSQRVHVDR